MKGSYRGEAFGKPVHTGAVGFRGPEEYPVKPAHACRILAIGDSRTYGFGVHDDETFAAVAQAGLRSRGLDAEVINAGVHGFSAPQCRVHLANLLKYRPDVVIFAPGYNDRYLVVRPPDSEASSPDRGRGGWWMLEEQHGVRAVVRIGQRHCSR